MKPLPKKVLCVTKWDACQMFQGENVFDVL